MQRKPPLFRSKTSRCSRNVHSALHLFRKETKPLDRAIAVEATFKTRTGMTALFSACGYGASSAGQGLRSKREDSWSSCSQDIRKPFQSRALARQIVRKGNRVPSKIRSGSLVRVRRSRPAGSQLACRCLRPSRRSSHPRSRPSRPLRPQTGE